jgi:excisionase family DNA binding protein
MRPLPSSENGGLAAGVNQESLLKHIASELNDIRRQYQQNGRTFPLRLEALRLLAVNGGQSRSEFDAEADAGNSLCMTYATAARRLAISNSSLRRLVKSGDIPTVSVGGSIRIGEADLQAYVATLDRRRSA